jgi:transcriptional regulator with XRE-family HTH domain
MPDSFGARLRQRRERQQITLSTIAEQTKIKVSLLEALEQDDVSHWPSGIFRRAFIRAYAHAIGLEPDVVVREFLELYPDPTEVVATVQAGASRTFDPQVSGAPPTRLRNLVGSAIGSLSRLGARSGPKPAEAVGYAAVIHSRMGANAGDPLADIPESEILDDGIVTAASLEADISAYEEQVETEPHPALALNSCDDERPAVEPAQSFLDDPTPMVPHAMVPNLLDFAHLCTELGRVDSTGDIAPVLQEATRLLDAVGLILWIWDAKAVELRPALAHGYSDRVLAQLPRVDRDTNNATAAAFRAAQVCVVKSSDVDSGAMVVPLMTPAGCAGVLAIELQRGREDSDAVRALAMIFAAQLATLIGSTQPAEASDRRLA